MPWRCGIRECSLSILTESRPADRAPHHIVIASGLDHGTFRSVQCAVGKVAVMELGPEIEHWAVIELICCLWREEDYSFDSTHYDLHE